MQNDYTPLKCDGHVEYDALDTFCLRLYGVGQIAREDTPLLRLHGRLFSISSKSSFHAPSHRQDNTYHRLCNISHGPLAGTRNI